MSRRYTSMKRKSYKPKRRRSSLNASNWWPLFKLILIIVLLLGFIAAVLYLVLPNVLPHFGVEFYPPGVTAPTPEPTPEPTPTPHPLSADDLSNLHKEIVVTATQYQWFGDPYYFNNSIVFTAGEVVEGSTRMTTLFMHDTATEEVSKLNIPLENDHFMFPAINDSYLVYLDARANGGGNIIVYSIEDGEFVNPRLVKEVYTGHPQIFLWDNYIAWTERTGTYMDKLFLCDLDTLESVTVQMFELPYYGTSLPHLKNSTLVWADVDSEDTSGQITSRISILDILSGTNSQLSFDMYVHDPKTDGEHIAWMDGNHGPDTRLYLARIDQPDASPTLVAEGIVDFFIGDGYLAYSKEETIWVYLFSEKRSFEITRDIEQAQLLGANDDVVMWMDVTSRDRDVIKYARIPS